MYEEINNLYKWDYREVEMFSLSWEEKEYRHVRDELGKFFTLVGDCWKKEVLHCKSCACIEVI